MYLHSIQGLNQKVKDSLPPNTRPSSINKAIDHHNYVIHLIVLGNVHNYLSDYEAVPINTKKLRGFCGTNIKYRKSETTNIINDLINWGYIYKDGKYMSHLYADIKNKVLISKGKTFRYEAHSINYGLTSKDGILKVGVMDSKSIEKLITIAIKIGEGFLNDHFHKPIMLNTFMLKFNEDKGLLYLQKLRDKSAKKLPKKPRKKNGQLSISKARIKRYEKKVKKVTDKLAFWEMKYEQLCMVNKFKTPEDYFKAQYWYYNDKNTVNRLYHFYSTIPKEFRSCLFVKGANVLWECDLKNAQPLILACKFFKLASTLKSKERFKLLGIEKNIKRKEQQYSICGLKTILEQESEELLNDVLNGNFYKRIADYSRSVNDLDFAQKFNKKYSEFKQDILGNGLYGILRAKSNVLKAEKYLMAVYPNFMKWIRQIKIDDGYKAVPIMAQRVESNIFIRSFFTQCNYFAVPIHDSIITTKENVDETLSILTTAILKEFPFLNKIKLESVIKVEPINKL